MTGKNKNTSMRLSNQSTKLIPRDISESLGKLPPQALELEEAILGAVMLEKKALHELMDVLKPEHFYSESHREIYQACIDLEKNSEPIDMRTVVNQLRKEGKIELVGGAFYIAELTSKVASAANMEYYARAIIEHYLKREMIQIASQVHQDAYEDTTDALSLLEKCNRMFSALTPYNTRNLHSAKDIMISTMKEIKDKLSADGITGVPSGFIGLDKITAGWQKSDLVIIAARPGMGKTAFVVNMLINASMNFKIPVALFSIEMSKNQLGMRMLSCLSEIDLEQIQRNMMDDSAWTKLTNKTSPFYNAPFHVDDSAHVAIENLRGWARKIKDEKKIELIVVDYMQLMTGDQNGNREQEISSISRGLKQIAKDLDIPIIALSQLSRGVESRAGDKRPLLSDLRESGSIEQDADIVIFLFRPEYYGIKLDSYGNSMEGVMEVIVSKHRNGKLGNVPLRFIGKYTKVTNYYPIHENRSLPSPAQAELPLDGNSNENKPGDDDTPF